MEKMELVAKYEASELTTNFNDLKEAVSNEVQKYSKMEVTENNIPEAKKVMANLNKVKVEISNKYKHHIDTLSRPINQLKLEKKEIENIITQGRQEIADNVSVFEAKRLEIAKDEITKYVIHECLQKRLNNEAIQTNDLIKLTAITANGTLTKATREAINSRISALENEVLKARLEAEEKAKRDREIAERAKQEAEERAKQREMQLQRENEERLQKERARAEKEKQEAVQRARAESVKISENIVPIEKVKPRVENEKVIYTVLATFEVPAPKSVSAERVKQALYKKFKECEFKTLKSVEVME